MIHDYDNSKFITKNETILLTEMQNEFLDELLMHKGDVTTYEAICNRLKRFNEVYNNKYKAMHALNSNKTVLKNKLIKYFTIKTKSKTGYYICEVKERMKKVICLEYIEKLRNDAKLSFDNVFTVQEKLYYKSRLDILNLILKKGNE